MDEIPWFEPVDEEDLGTLHVPLKNLNKLT